MSCCSTCGEHACACGCGAATRTPLSLYNRPGLAGLAYRVGTWSSFHATMQMDLSGGALPALAKLRTRESDDPAMALLDAWAIGADVLSFYQERIANEGYLRTATERRSVLELGRLVDYRLRPGVSASVYLAYTVEKDSPPVTIPAGARAQSIPAPGEQMQTFETAEPLDARYEWNALQPRLTRPQNITFDNVLHLAELWVTDATAPLKANQRLLFVFGNAQHAVIRQVRSTDDTQPERGHIVFQPVADATLKILDAAAVALAALQATGPGRMEALWMRYIESVQRGLRLGGSNEGSYQALMKRYARTDASADAVPAALDFRHAVEAAFGTVEPPLPPGFAFGRLFAALKAAPNPQPANRLKLSRNVHNAFASGSDVRPQLLLTLEPRLLGNFYRAWADLRQGDASPGLSSVFVLRLAAPLFGYNAPKVMGLGANQDSDTKGTVPYVSRPDGDPPGNETDGHVQLDNAYEGVLAGSFLLIEPEGAAQVARARSVRIHPRTDYGISGKTTDIELDGPPEEAWSPSSMDELRATQVYAQSEPLTLTQEIIADPIGRLPDDPATPRTTTDDANRLTLDGVLDGFVASRWVAIEGQRADVPGTGAVAAAELVMVSAVEQGTDPSLPGDTLHSTLVFAGKGLAYSYRRDSVTVYANVVRATHGETRNEILGSGNGAASMQAFALKQPPLTYVSAPTVDGVQSTLVVRVNGLQWHELDNLAFADERARSFATATDDDGRTRVLFGDGAHGARLPTGVENVVARYRNGIGLPGNVQARQISLLGTRPLGVKDVINPLRATGGADPETRDQARGNVPLAVRALDRLVSVPDYADFARMFGGVGKAAADRLGAQVLVTVAGAADAPIEATSDLYRNLILALQRYGDPSLAVSLAVRELLALTLSARIGLAPDYDWTNVEPQVRAALLDRFGFERRALAQDAYLSEVVGCVQAVAGVAWIDVDAFDSLGADALVAVFEQDESKRTPDIGPQLRQRVQALPARYGTDGQALPAQLACFLPAVPDTLLLQEATP